MSPIFVAYSPPFKAESRLKERIALITGASRGVGRAVALRFAQEGAHVILLARSLKALESLDDEIKSFGGSATLVPFNLKETSLIPEMTSPLFNRFGKLDIFIGNAAVLGTLSPLTHLPYSMFEEVMTVNFIANWALLKALDPLLKKSDAGRVIFLTSNPARTPKAYWGAYGASKAALEHLVQTYALEVEKTRLRVNLLDPGSLQTRMRQEAMPGEDPLSLPLPEQITNLFVELCSPLQQENGKTYCLR